MIIIQDKNIESLVYFHKNLYSNNIDLYRLVLNDRATNKIYEFDNLEDNCSVNDFYTFFIDFSDLPEGEYEYKIFTNEVEVASGLIRLNALELDNVFYPKNNEYIAYGETR